MTIEYALPTSDYVEECVEELLRYGRTEVVVSHTHRPGIRQSLIMKVMNSYTVNYVRCYDISFKSYETSTTERYHAPLWLVIPLKVYSVTREDLDRILLSHLYQRDGGELHPETWGLNSHQWGYSSERAMNKFWDLVREVYHHPGPYPYQLTYCMTALTGEALITIVIDSPTGRRAEASLSVGKQVLSGTFPLAGEQREFKLVSGELGRFNDLFDGPVLLDIARIQ